MLDSVLQQYEATEHVPRPASYAMTTVPDRSRSKGSVSHVHLKDVVHTHVFEKGPPSLVLVPRRHGHGQCQDPVVNVNVGARMTGVVLEQADRMSSENAG